MNRGDCVMTIADGKVEVRVDDSVYDQDPSLGQEIHKTLNGRFLGVVAATIVSKPGAKGETAVAHIRQMRKGNRPPAGATIKPH
jgi:hypothetical protein